MVPYVCPHVPRERELLGGQDLALCNAARRSSAWDSDDEQLESGGCRGQGASDAAHDAERRRQSIARQLHSTTSACSRMSRCAGCACAASRAASSSALVRGRLEPPHVGNRTLPAESGLLTSEQPTGAPAPRRRACPAAQIQLGRTPTARGLGCDGFEREHVQRCSKGHSDSRQTLGVGSMRKKAVAGGAHVHEALHHLVPPPRSQAAGLLARVERRGRRRAVLLLVLASSL